ncbi:MAG TPA: sulfite exporter TauE/SafE family protein [Terriglobales bacterium]|nr:sulfite exporter TauE/SafE family protein [Terriglobales bacterium]
MHFSEGVFLFLAALIAGGMNSVAGGGSFISFPALLFVKIPPVNANATNTVALWPGQPASVWAYRGELRKLPRSTVIPLTITGVIGGLIGGWVLLITPQATFMALVPWLLLIATVIFMMSGRITRWVRQRSAHTDHGEFATGRGVILQLFIAFYIGYFGAGAGILILAMLALLGMDYIHAMNALKTWLTTVSNGVAMVLFVVSHAVYWPEAIVMIAASMLGGYFGAYFAQKTKPENVRLIVIVIGFVLTIYFFARQFRH